LFVVFTSATSRIRNSHPTAWTERDIVDILRDKQMLPLLICTEIRAKNGDFLHRRLTHLLFSKPLKRLLFVLLEAGHFWDAKVGSI